MAFLYLWPEAVTYLFAVTGQHGMFRMWPIFSYLSWKGSCNLSAHPVPEVSISLCSPSSQTGRWHKSGHLGPEVVGMYLPFLTGKCHFMLFLDRKWRGFYLFSGFIAFFANFLYPEVVLFGSLALWNLNLNLMIPMKRIEQSVVCS